MKPSEILREAARRIADKQNDYGCIAIDRVLSPYPYEVYMARRYFKMFEPSIAGNVWFGATKSKVNRNRRVIALCLAAAIAKSEGQ